MPAWNEERMRALSSGLQVALLLLLAACGALLLTDRPGLRAKYFALGAPWKGEPLSRTVEEPGQVEPAHVEKYLSTPVLFSIRWRGWWNVAQGGEHQFFLKADDGGYLRIDGKLIVEASKARGRLPTSGRAVLAPGFHKLEIGYFQNDGVARMALRWAAPGSGDRPVLPVADLYPEGPLAWRRLLRQVGSAWPQAYRQILGALFLSTGLSLLGGFVSRSVSDGTGLLAGLRARLPAVDRHRLHVVLLVALFIIVLLAVFPYTGMLYGGDDTDYLMAATFDRKLWFVQRYAHVYLLKLFTFLSGGDPLVGVRVWWSFVMATTVAALAVAVRSVGPRLQLRTLAATLFVLLAQPTLWGLIGGGFADYSAMMFVTVATATCMHGIARDRERAPPRHEWHALLIGALTVAAIRSKEVGAVLLLLPALFLIGPGATLELRRCARKLAYWSVGALAVLLALTLLDGWILGDPYFALKSRPRRSLNFRAGVGLRGSSWFEKIWYGEQMRVLWMGVVAAAVVAGARRRELQLRLLHLLPIAYLLALIVLYLWLPHPFSTRMLIPILPLACLMIGLLLHDAGLDEVAWRTLARPAILIPVGVAAALVFLVIVPLQRGTLEAATLLPVDLLLRFGWTPENFVTGVLLPTSVLSAIAGVALVAGRGPARVAALLVAYLVVYGVGFEVSRSSLAGKWAVQKGQLLVYPWQTFRKELDARPGGKIALSSDLKGRYRMTATAESSIARLALRRRNVRVDVSDEIPADARSAIGSRAAYQAWTRRNPSLAETASFGPSGFLVLVRPQPAAEDTKPRRAGKPTAPPEK